MARWKQTATPTAHSLARVYCTDPGDDREGLVDLIFNPTGARLIGPVYQLAHDDAGAVTGKTVIDPDPTFEG